MSILKLKNEDFDDDLNLLHPKAKSGKTVILFFSPMCGHCVHFHPTYEQLAKDNADGVLGDNITIAEVNTSENRDLMGKIHNPSLMSRRHYLVQGIPTVVSYSNGQFFSIYANGSKGSSPYRSLDDLKDYIEGIGSAEVTYVSN